MTLPLSGRSVLVIVSGGIAACKTPDLVARLREAGARVRCVLTANGARFVTPQTLAALSGQPVFGDLWEPAAFAEMNHIRLSRESDLVVVVPATANLLAKMAQGLADDLASTLLLASAAPILVAPAMNLRMWRHPATQANMALLRARGVGVVGPASGALACGESGEGRMVEVPEILAAVCTALGAAGPLRGKKALVTSGPTFEPLDPVRFLGNRSSGKQGHAIAEALARRGAETVLVTGPTALPDPPGLRVVRVETARAMLEACRNALPCDIVVGAAAVSDWRPVAESPQKIKKADSGPPSLELTENPDILATLARVVPRPALVVGFAAETGDVRGEALRKLERKGCDWLLANPVGEGRGFGSDVNEVTFFARQEGGAVADPWPSMDKAAVAARLADKIVAFFEASRDTGA